MVHLSRILSAIDKKSGFIDKVRVYARGGPGGQGLPKYGGCGGRGGHVYVVADEKTTLKRLISNNPKKRFVGKAGANSRVRALLGETGADYHIHAPPGVSIVNDGGRVLGDLNEHGDRVFVARGGAGGCPENNFLGQKGAATSVKLDLKLIADIGLVGFPNAGKSTFLSSISRAAPKIASYAFTTLKPQIGVMQYDDLRQISVADLPGLIEGAHVNVGMGHHFLKHVERTQLLLFMVDVTGFQLSMHHPTRTALETIVLLNKELQLYKESLLSKPCVLALNKIDLPDTEDKVQEVMEQLKDLPEAVKSVPDELLPETLVTFDEVITISARQQLNTDYLKQRLRHWLDVNHDLQTLEDRGRNELMTPIKDKLREHWGGGHYV